MGTLLSLVLTLVGFLALALPDAGGAQAGGINWTPIEKIENAPLLAVCRVEEIVPGQLIPSPTDPSRTPDRYYDAQLLVLRSYANLNGSGVVPEAGQRITLRYVGKGIPPYPTGFGLQWLQLQGGQVALFPLIPAGEGGIVWRLAVANATNLIVPALENPTSVNQAPNTGREFILRELANTLANGTPSQQREGAAYFGNMPDVPPELRGFIEEMIGTDEDQWLQLGATFLSFVGSSIRPPSVVELAAGTYQITHSPTGRLDPTLRGYEWTSWVLQKGAQRDFPDRLLRILVHDAPARPWEMSQILTQFKDSPALNREMTAVLQARTVGSLYIAWLLARTEPLPFLPDALAFARELAAQPGSATQSDLRAAEQLLRAYDR